MSPLTILGWTLSPPYALAAGSREWSVKVFFCLLNRWYLSEKLMIENLVRSQ